MRLYLLIFIIFSAVVEKKGPLVIPLAASKNNLIDRAKEAKFKREEQHALSVEIVKPDAELSIDELAARELIRGLFS